MNYNQYKTVPSSNALLATLKHGILAPSLGQVHDGHSSLPHQGNTGACLIEQDLFHIIHWRVGTQQLLKV